MAATGWPQSEMEFGPIEQVDAQVNDRGVKADQFVLELDKRDF